MTTITLTALNGYFGVVRLQLYKKVFGGKWSFVIIAVSWLFVAVFVIYLTVFGLAQFSFNPALSFCTYTFGSKGAQKCTTLDLTVVCVFSGVLPVASHAVLLPSSKKQFL